MANSKNNIATCSSFCFETGSSRSVVLIIIDINAQKYKSNGILHKEHFHTHTHLGPPALWLTVIDEPVTYITIKKMCIFKIKHFEMLYIHTLSKSNLKSTEKKCRNTKISLVT